jgi:hypothetical protein
LPIRPGTLVSVTASYLEIPEERKSIGQVVFIPCITEEHLHTVLPIKGTIDIPVQSSNHEQLLELLRTLDEAVKLSWISRWHNELPSST